ncbi:SCP2 sterol-binding domain-containing protein [Thermoplasma sp.]|uniref:SCP2 sterol-binding domain-containing protein n=1 Tax=Thermoplasma sp. TaxID=1973142 RepID=UPI00261D9211|nr:SCP2 sterol-binding domain-containing protein [Thermoplasma sp.]
MEFGSNEYLEKVKEVTNGDKKYRDMIKNEDASYTFIIQADPANGVGEDIIIGYRLKNGEMSDIWKGERATDFVISGKYQIWVDLLTGKQSVTSAFISRKLNIRGEFSRILKMAGSTEYWLTLLRKIPTEFQGKYSSYNIKGN